MSRLRKIWHEITEMNSENQVFNFWDTRQNLIIDSLRSAETLEDIELAGFVMHKLAKAFNNREKYSSVYYLFISAYQSIEDRIKGGPESIHELKYELARGLHYNRKYKYSKQLFNELAATGFDTDRIENWWNQSAFASTRDRVWIKYHILPGMTRFLIMVAYLIVLLRTEEFVIATMVFIGLSLFTELQWYLYRVNHYLKEYESDPETELIKKKIKTRIVIQFVVSLLIFPLYFLGHELLYFSALLLVTYINAYHYILELYYLPNLIGYLNRKKVLNTNLAPTQP